MFTKVFHIIILIGVLLMTCAVAPILEITDGTPANTLNLLDPKAGFHLKEWPISIPSAKDGGVYESSPMQDGQMLKIRKFTSGFQSIELMARERGQNELIAYIRKLFGLLNAAVEYHTSSWATTPVYLKVRAPEETTTSYALIKNWQSDVIGNFFAQPLFSGGGMRVADKLNIMLEHDFPQDTPPGTGSCLAVDDLTSWPLVQQTLQLEPQQSEDDVMGSSGGVDYSTTWQYFYLGKVKELHANGGIRFPNATIPPGSTIVAAYITFTAYPDNSVPGINPLWPWYIINMMGHLTDISPVFSPTDTTDLWRRIIDYPTSNHVIWFFDDPWVAGQTYRTPDITRIVQELIDQDGWISGSPLTIMFKSDGGVWTADDSHRRPASWDSTTYVPPQLTIVYRSATYNFGRSSTCLDEVFIENGSRVGNISHVFYYDDSLLHSNYSANLVGTYPYNLFPDPVGVGDKLYLISDVDIEGAAPFSNAVLNILVNDNAFNAGVAYRYWDGAAWSALDVQDHTGYDISPFMVDGVNSMHWVPPLDWETTTVNGVTGWAVEIEITSLLTSPVSPPSQITRDIYTISRNAVNIDSGVLPGDVTLLTKWMLHNQSDRAGVRGDGPEAWVNRVIAGARSVSRGENFRSFINFAEDQHNPHGVHAFQDYDYTELINWPRATTGQAWLYTPSALHLDEWKTAGTISFDSNITSHYYGRFHAYMRVYQIGGSTGDLTLKLRISTLNGNSIDTQTDIPLADKGWDLVDFGLVRIPTVGELTPADVVDNVMISVQVYATVAGIYGPTMNIYDLALIPVDEWAIDAIGNNVGLDFRVGYDKKLVIDSISIPKRPRPRGMVIRASDSLTMARYNLTTSGPAVLQHHADQRVWFLFQRYDEDSGWSSEPWVAFSVRAERVARYLALIGEG